MLALDVASAEDDRVGRRRDREREPVARGDGAGDRQQHRRELARRAERGRVRRAVHRANFHAALRETVQADSIRMGTIPKDIEERGDGVTVAFEDGPTEVFNLVVGADGVHSTVRKQCFTDWQKRKLDTYVWSLWAPQDTDIGSDMVSVWGPGSEGFVVRVGDRIGFNFAAQLETPPASPGEKLRAEVTAVDWQFPAILEETEDEPFFDRVREVSCGTWHSDRVALVGDAAHAIHPISGMGASLAMQDARVLAQELATAAPNGISKALTKFEERRRQDVSRVQRQARIEAAVTFLDAASLRWVRNPHHEAYARIRVVRPPTDCQLLSDRVASPPCSMCLLKSVCHSQRKLLHQTVTDTKPVHARVSSRETLGRLIHVLQPGSALWPRYKPTN